MNLRTISKMFLVSVAAFAVGSCSLLPSSVNNALNDSLQITADFKNIAGMYEGNPVTVLGLDVGTVDKIVPKDTFVEVHMSIDEGIDIPADAIAAIISPSIVTNRHIELTPAYTGGETMSDGDHLTLERTRTPVELDAMIETIDQFAAALKPEPGAEGVGPLSARVLFPMFDGKGEKMRDTLNALSSALKVGVDNKGAISNIIIQLNELTTMLAHNDQSVRDFSNRMTQLTGLLAEQAPGLQATLAQLNKFLANTSTTFAQYSGPLAESLTGLTEVTNQLRENARGLTEVVDLAPLLMQNLDRSMNHEGGFVRLHANIPTFLNGELLSVFCREIQMRADGCRTGKLVDMGPDLGFIAAILGMTK